VLAQAKHTFTDRMTSKLSDEVVPVAHSRRLFGGVHDLVRGSLCALGGHGCCTRKIDEP
jgi:hypothetical protein